MLALKLKLLKSRMVGYTRLMLGFCKKEAETRQRHRETVKMEKTAKAHIQTHFSSRRGCLGDIIMFNTRSDSWGSTILSLLSSPDYKTVTSVISVIDRSDSSVTSVHVFWAKIGPMAVF